MTDFRVIQRYLKCGLCPIHHQDINMFCQDPGCHNNRLFCQQCKINHRQHKTSTCKHKFSQICQKLSKVQRLGEQYRNQAALNLNNTYQLISKLKEQYDKAGKAIQSLELDAIRAYHEGLLYKPDQIFHHIDISRFKNEEWEKLEKIAVEWSSLDLQELRFDEYSQQVLSETKQTTEKIEKIIQQLIAQINRIQDLASFKPSNIQKFKQAKQYKKSEIVQEKIKHAFHDFLKEQIIEQEPTISKKSSIKMEVGSQVNSPKKEIVLVNQDYSDDMLISYLEGQASELFEVQKIDLSHNSLTDEGLTKIFDLVGNRMTKLKYLNLSHNQLTDNCLEILINVRLPQLSHLNLEYNHINNTMDGIMKIYGSNQFESLDEIMIENQKE